MATATISSSSNATRPLPVDAIVGNPLVVDQVDNQATTQQLQDNYAWESCRFQLTGTVTNASYSAAPSLYAESIENLMASINITATGRGAGGATNQLCNVDAGTLRAKTYFMQGVLPYRVNIGTGNSAYPFESNFTRYFIDPHSNVPQFFMLNSALLNTLNVQVQWRDVAAMVYGGTGGTSTLSDCQYTLTARRYLNYPLQQANPYMSESQRTFTPTATTALFPCRQIPVGQILRRQWFKALQGQNAFSDPSDSLFTYSAQAEGAHLQMVVQNAVYLLNEPAPNLRADNIQEWQLASPLTGYWEWEPARNGNIRNSIPLSGVQNADNYIDVTTNEDDVNTIIITDEQIIGLASWQWQGKAAPASAS